jgi:Holliday junction resolvasome RuvABC ATP-dependent DNA helicase subunit
LTVDGRTPLQTLLLGQPQFRRALASTSLDQLRQRVLTSYHLGPLSRDETRGYVEHRLSAVGWDGDPVFEEAAFEAVYGATDGVPRRVNRLCSRVLLYGALEETHDITAAMVEQTADELQRDLEGVRAEWANLPPVPAAAVNGGAANFVSADLVSRVEALEQQMAQREQVFRRLTQMLGVR